MNIKPFRRKKSKQWCSNKQNLPIWEKFEDDPDKRVYIFDIHIKQEYYCYLEKRANRKATTRSAVFEQMLDRYFFYYFENSTFPKRRYLDRTDSVKLPKLLVHPVYSRLIKELAEQNNTTITLIIDTIFSIFIEKYPIKIDCPPI